jgi:hypothetical protein
VCIVLGPCQGYVGRTDEKVSQARVEAGSNTSTAVLRVLGGDQKRTQGHPVPGGYKDGDLALQVGGVSNLRQ